MTAVAVVALLIGLLTLVNSGSWPGCRRDSRLRLVPASWDHLLHLPVRLLPGQFPGVVVGRLDQIDTINQLIADPLITSG